MLRIGPDSCFAHRGLHDLQHPRNSLSAIVAAADAGYGIEFDVHLSADGVPIVSHDPDTRADTGVDCAIASTPAAALTALRFLQGGEPLATLDDVVRAVGPGVPLLVEIKPTRRRREVVAAVAARIGGREHSVALQSFDPGVVHAAQRQCPGFAVGQLGDTPSRGQSAVQRAFWSTLPTNLWTRPDFLALPVPMLQRPMVRFWRARLGCALLAWTVVDDEGARRSHAAGAGLIFESMRPGVGGQQRGGA